MKLSLNIIIGSATELVTPGVTVLKLESTSDSQRRYHMGGIQAVV